MRRAARRSEGAQFGHQAAVRAEQLLAAGSSCIQSSSSFRCAGLSRTSENGTWCERQEPSALWPLTSFGPVQPLGLRSTIIGQRGRSALPLARASLLDRADLRDGLVQGRGHLLVHLVGVGALDEVGRVAVAAEQRLQFLVADARQDGGVGDLVAVEVEDRQHRAVAHRVDELVGMPGGGERPGLGLAVAHDAGDDQFRVVEARRRRHGRGCSPVRRPRGSSRESPA